MTGQVVADHQVVAADLVNPLQLATIRSRWRVVMEDVNLFPARVEFEVIRVRMRLLVQPDGVMIAIHDPLHIGVLRFAIIRAGNQVPGALPLFGVVGGVRDGTGAAACEQTTDEREKADPR